MSGPPHGLQAGATSPCPGADVRHREETRLVTNSSKSTEGAPGLAGPKPQNRKLGASGASGASGTSNTSNASNSRGASNASGTRNASGASNASSASIVGRDSVREYGVVIVSAVGKN